MMKRFKMMALAIVMVASFGLAPVPAYAACSSLKDCANDGVKASGGNTAKSLTVGEIIRRVVQVLMFILAAVSVIMIIISGIKYTTSQGDSSAVASAKNTLLYSIVGLLVAIFSYAIVDFVIKQF